MNADAPAPRKRLGRPSKQDMQAGPDAKTLLLHAASAEFVELGYAGTSSNRISQRAGFAPQTFYRWYKDKLEVFIEVFHAWAEAELAQLEAMLTEPNSSLQIAEACVENHRSFLVFKRSLRQLAQEAPEIRQARAISKQAQIQRILQWQGATGVLSQDTIAALLIGIEHWCEALAEGEFSDLGLGGHTAYAQLASMIEQLRPAAPAQG